MPKTQVRDFGFGYSTSPGLAAMAFAFQGQKGSQRRKKAPVSATFASVAAEWMTKNEREGRSKSTLEKIHWLLAMTEPMVGTRPISEIGPQDVLAVLRKIEARGHYETAQRMRSVFSRVFRYAVATGSADRDVVSDLRGALITPKVKHRAAITTQEEVGPLLRAIAGYKGQGITRIALQLAAHLFVRPGELRTAEWSEINLSSALWLLPAEKMKMRRPHRVPLSRQVLAMLRQMQLLSGSSKFLLPSHRGPEQCMSENTLNLALRRLGYQPNEMTAHGFRAMAASLLSEMGIWNPDAIERQLAHQDSNSVRRAYVRAEYWEERIRMMQHWSDYLDQLRANS